MKMWVRKISVSLVACAGLMASTGTQEARACGWCGSPCWREALYTPVRVLYTPVRVVRSFFRGGCCYSPCDPCVSSYCSPCVSPCSPCASPCEPCGSPCSSCPSVSYYTPITSYYQSSYYEPGTTTTTACCGTMTNRPLEPVPQAQPPAQQQPMQPAQPMPAAQPMPETTPPAKPMTANPGASGGRITWGHSLTPDAQPTARPASGAGPRLLPAAPSLRPVAPAVSGSLADTAYQWKPVKKSVLTAERTAR